MVLMVDVFHMIWTYSVRTATVAGSRCMQASASVPLQQRRRGRDEALLEVDLCSAYERHEGFHAAARRDGGGDPQSAVLDPGRRAVPANDVGLRRPGCHRGPGRQLPDRAR